MPDIEINNNHTKAKLLYSSTIELFACLQLLTIPSHHELLIDFASNTEKHLSKDSKTLLAEISKFQFHGLELFEIILDINILDDISMFLEQLLVCSDVKFISIITMERLEEKQIELIIQREIDDQDIENLLPWIYKESISEMSCLLFHPSEFKVRFANLLLDIYHSPYFLPQVEANQYKYQESIQYMANELKKKTPLVLGQQIMNKTFKNVFDYKQYIFCPAYFISPHRLRIHNKDTNIVIYDINKNHLYVNKMLDKITVAMKILSDGTRLEILRQLSIKPTYGKVLANSLDLTTATISHHLDILKSIGLIREKKEKNIKYFYINNEEAIKIFTLTENYIQNKI